MDSTEGGDEKGNRTLVGKPGAKILVWSPIRRLQDNIKIYFRVL